MGVIGKTDQGRVENRNMRNRITTGLPWIKIIIILIVFISLPLFLGEGGLSLAAEMLIWALAAAALNVLLGDCGIVSFGHAGFFAVGAYAFGLLSYYHLVSFPVAIILAIVAILLYSVIIGWFIVRLVEIYFALLCLAFAQVVWVIASVWYGVTGGDDGLTGVPVINWLYSATNSYYFILGVVVISLLALYLIRESPFGRSLHALRDNRTRAGFVGIDTRRYIYIAFVISGLFCGIAGILLVILLRCAFPGYAHFLKSGDFLFVCLLGGMYNFTGPIVGAFLFILLNFFISRYTEYWPLFMGLGTISIALFFRGGVTGFIEEKYQAFKIRRGMVK